MRILRLLGPRCCLAATSCCPVQDGDGDVVSASGLDCISQSADRSMPWVHTSPHTRVTQMLSIEAAVVVVGSSVGSTMSSTSSQAGAKA